MSELATAILNAHKPGQHAYLCLEVGLDRNAENTALVDRAYGELVDAGYVVESSPTVMPYHGVTPRKTFTLTELGQQAQNGG